MDQLSARTVIVRLVATRGTELYAAYLVGCVVFAFPLFLQSYGVGGDVPASAQTASGHYLNNHGDLTPISDSYHALIQWSMRLVVPLWVISLPLGLAGLAHYFSLVDPNRRHANVLVWLALFVPVREESTRLGFAKAWCVLLIASLVAFQASPISACPESAFLGRIALCYAITALLAAAIAQSLRATGYLRRTDADSA